MTAEAIAVKLGQAGSDGKDWWRCLCPICNKPNLSLRDNPNGKVKLSIKCYSGCNKTRIQDELRRRHFLNGANGSEGDPESEEEHKSREAAEAIERKRRVDEALDIWRNGLPYKGTIADTYCCSRLLLEHSAALRFVPALHHKLEKRSFPALIGLVEHQDDGVVGIHCIFLEPLDPSAKPAADKRKLSYGPVGGGAIRLFPIEGDTLSIGEGVEDCIAFYQAHKIPAWCTPTAAGVKGFVPPTLDQVTRIILIEDQDPVGRQAVAEKAAELAHRGYEIQIARPLKGKDPNEVLRAIGLDKPVCDFEKYKWSPKFSDDYMALLFSSCHRADLRFVAVWGKWLQWIGNYWHPEQTLQTFDFARALCREVAKTADISKQAAVDLTGSSSVAAVERLARSDRRHAATTEQWNYDDWIFNNFKQKEEK
jgi:hypothetical protein